MTQTDINTIATPVDRLEYYRHQYAMGHPEWESATARYQRWVAERLTPHARVLDLGCGRGGIIERLHARARWWGIDVDGASLREHRVPRFARSQAQTEHLPFPDDTFDLVVSSWVLEHAGQPRALFKEVSRILQPRGRFILLTPNARHPIPRLSRALAQLEHLQKRVVARFYGRAGADTFPVHYQANTPEALDHFTTQAGLHRERLVYVKDPSYFAWNGATFWLATRLERYIPITWKVHLVVEYKIPA